MPIAPYGTWSSPISAADTTKAGIVFTDLVVADGDAVLWAESRPLEGGRTAIVRRTASGEIADVGPADFNTRTRVHEYGGGAFAVRDGVVFATRFEDQRIYRIEGSEATAITPEPELAAGLRYADFAFGPSWMIAVCERHRGDGGEAVNELVRIDLDTGEVTSVMGGSDFFSSPRISPDGTQLAWLTWEHPDMPWDATRLWRGRLSADGELSGARPIAGGGGESLLQPEWSPDGRLHVVSDRSDWWNIYEVGAEGALAPVLGEDDEFAVPHWLFGRRRFAFLADGSLVAMSHGQAGDRLLVLDGAGVRRIEVPYPTLGNSPAVSEGKLSIVAAGPDRFPALVRIDLGSGDIEILRAPDDPGIPDGYISIPKTVTFDTPDGPAYALHYPPANPGFTAPEGEKPPIIVDIHGGPTGAVSSVIDPKVLFWTSRGFGVVDVDYSGSSGYGRAYRDRLQGQWGIADVRDCALAAAHVAATGGADQHRLLIHGGSAGGYTTLLALATRDEFAAGASYFGVADLGALAEHTHKFESRYLDGLVGPYPEAADTYRERSPITHVDRLDKPVILLQGSDDRVVPPAQAEMMRDALVDNEIPVAYVLFEGEGHGFRVAENQARALESELVFYGMVLGFEPAGDLPAVTLETQ